MPSRSTPPPATAEPFIPPSRSLSVLHDAAQKCQGCDLYKDATQAVFGEGPLDAPVVFVGEVPGPSEDQAGRPFVGPAGKIFDSALAEAGIDRRRVYVTNAVKHFKWKPSPSDAAGKLVAKPTTREMRACRPWLETELSIIKPQGIVCLGATASQSLLGPDFRVTQQRGQFLQTPWAPWLLATVHPSAILRIPNRQVRQEAQQNLIADLRLVAKKLNGKS